MGFDCISRAGGWHYDSDSRHVPVGGAAAKSLLGIGERRRCREAGSDPSLAVSGLPAGLFAPAALVPVELLLAGEGDPIAHGPPVGLGGGADPLAQVLTDPEADECHRADVYHPAVV